MSLFKPNLPSGRFELERNEIENSDKGIVAVLFAKLTCQDLICPLRSSLNENEERNYARLNFRLMMENTACFMMYFTFCMHTMRLM